MTRRVPTAAAAALLSLALLAGPAAGAATVAWERNVTANLMGNTFPYNDAFEPVVATHPFQGNRLAVVFSKPARAGCGVIPVVRTSIDSGQTWQNATGKPWAGSGRQPNWHAAIAWGPGPTPGSARLYWADTTVNDCSFDTHRLSVAYSDDRGATWSPLFVYKGTPATPVGGFPEITVDRDPDSPNYGAVYAAVNWLPTSTSEPGLRVIASRNFGQTWVAAEVPPLPEPPGNPFAYRIGYRLRAAPDGAVYATFCQADRPSQGGFANRLSFGISRLVLDWPARTLSAGAPVLATEVAANGYTMGYSTAPGTHDRQRLNTCNSHGIDVDGATGRIYLAVGNYRTNVDAGTPRGVVRFGRSDDGGQTWEWQTLPTISPVGGRAQSAHRPTLAVAGGKVVVGFHVISDVALSSTYNANATVANAYTMSEDGGDSFATPALISPSRWHSDWLSYKYNGAGLRDRAETTAAGRVFYAFGDGRHAALKPSANWGRGMIYGTLIDVGP